MRRLPTVLLAVAVATWSTGCAEPPTAQVDAAKAKLAAAAAEGATFAADAYKAAQDAGAQLDAELTTQSETFALFRSFDRATELAASLEAAADRVTQAVTAEKARQRAEAERVVADAKRAVSDAKASLEKLSRRQAAALAADLTTAESALGEADSSLSGGQLEEARRRAEAAVQALTPVNTAVAEAEAAIAARQAGPGEVFIPTTVLADGKPLAAGSYAVRLTNEQPPPVVGQTAGSERWVEFVRSGTVRGRALALALSPAEIREVAETPGPANNDARVEMLKDREYVRVWLNRGGTNYLIHMPPAPRSR